MRKEYQEKFDRMESQIKDQQEKISQLESDLAYTCSMKIYKKYTSGHSK